jgi:hypothetical protein
MGFEPQEMKYLLGTARNALLATRGSTPRYACRRRALYILTELVSTTSWNGQILNAIQKEDDDLNCHPTKGRR